MNHSNHLPDTPWHVGYAKKREDDPRRHKARCIYNNDGICDARGQMKCPGSAHCPSYCENQDENLKSVTYHAVRSNIVWATEDVKAVCNDRRNKKRQRFLKDINT